MNELYGEVGKISPTFKLIQTIGGKKFVHARGCPIISDWDICGCRELYQYKKDKFVACPACQKFVFITTGANDYAENWRKYNRLFQNASDRLVREMFLDKNATCCWNGDRLYITCKEDSWYIDTNFDDIRLFHNNYSTTERLETGEVECGYHEHELDCDMVTTKLNNCLRQINKYDFEKAAEVHKKKREKVGRRTFSEFDPEYYGFSC